MLDPASADNAAHANIVGWIEEGHRGPAFPHQAGKIAGVARIPAQQALLAQLPQIARLAHRRGRGPLGIDRVVGSEASCSKSTAS